MVEPLDLWSMSYRSWKETICEAVYIIPMTCESHPNTTTADLRWQVTNKTAQLKKKKPTSDGKWLFYFFLSFSEIVSILISLYSWQCDKHACFSCFKFRMQKTEGYWLVDSWSKMTVAALQLFNGSTDPWYQQTAFIEKIYHKTNVLLSHI